MIEGEKGSEKVEKLVTSFINGPLIKMSLKTLFVAVHNTCPSVAFVLEYSMEKLVCQNG